MVEWRAGNVFTKVDKPLRVDRARALAYEGNIGGAVKETLQSLYYDIDLLFNDTDAEIHLYSLNYYSESDLDSLLQKTKLKSKKS